MLGIKVMTDRRRETLGTNNTREGRSKKEKEDVVNSEHEGESRTPRRTR